MPIDFDGLNKRKQQRGRGPGWKPEKGDNIIRILPADKRAAEEPVDYIALQYTVHFIRQEGYETVVTRCPRDEGNQCPICAAYSRHRETADPGLKKYVEGRNSIKRVEQHVFNIIDRRKNPTAGIQPFVCGYKVWHSILEFASNPGWGDITSPGPDGRDIVLKFIPANEARSGFNEYVVEPAPEKSSALDHLPDDWKDQLDSVASGAIPPVLPASELSEIVARLGFPVQGSSQSSHSSLQVDAFASPATQPSMEAGPTQEAAAGSAARPAEGAPAAPQPTPAALERAGSNGLVQPPATSPEQTPFCFGMYGPESPFPCMSCAVRLDCQMAKLGV